MLLLQRSTFLAAFMFSLFNLQKQQAPMQCDPRTCVKHEAPPGVDYTTNPTVFGRILRGELPARTLKETKDLFVFEDIRPRAPLHALVIPKRFVASVYNVDLALVQELHAAATELLQEQQPKAYADNDYILCFHVPPFNSIGHLHLHVLAPASQMGWPFRHIKYQANTRWCLSLDSVERRLRMGKSPVPYQRPW